MSVTGWSTANYLKYASAVVSAYPLTFACWAQGNGTAYGNAASTNRLMSLDSGGGNYIYLGVNGAGVTTGVNTTVAVSSAGAPTSGWFHAAGVNASSTDRRAFLNGANKGTNTTSAAFPAATQTDIGCVPTVSAWKASGLIAHAAIWNIALSDADIAALGKGLSPLRMHPESLVAYWPLDGLSPEPNRKSNAAVLSIVGSLSKGASSPIIYLPRRRRIIV